MRRRESGNAQSVPVANQKCNVTRNPMTGNGFGLCNDSVAVCADILTGQTCNGVERITRPAQLGQIDDMPRTPGNVSSTSHFAVELPSFDALVLESNDFRRILTLYICIRSGAHFEGVSRFGTQFALSNNHSDSPQRSGPRFRIHSHPLTMTRQASSNRHQGSESCSFSLGKLRK